MSENNNLGGLNDLLFTEMRRLLDPELKGEELQMEMERAKAVAGIAKCMIDNANTALNAQKFVADTYGRHAVKQQKMLQG